MNIYEEDILDHYETQAIMGPLRIQTSLMKRTIPCVAIRFVWISKLRTVL